MKKLLGTHGGKAIIQENGIVRLENLSDDFKNIELVRARDEIVFDPLSSREITGEGVFDFRYGPVTGGVAEAGVFHLYTYGERILLVEVDASYKARKIEEKMKGKTVNEALILASKVCGNFSVSHSLAFVRAVENALKIPVPKDVKILRAVALELERIYNHIHVISKLASAAAQLVLASHLQGLFEESLRINKLFSNSRFLDGFVKFGGVDFSPSRQTIEEIIKGVKRISENFRSLFEHSMVSRNYIDRLHATATLNAQDAELIGLTGPSLRACNVGEDLRKVEEIYTNLKVVTDEEGDSLSRMEVRAHEIAQSANFVAENLKRIGKVESGNANMEAFGEGLGSCESPSGSVVYHVCVENGKVNDAYVSTPSLFGFAAIAHSLVGNIFTDFPFAVESYGVNFADAAR